MLVNYYKQNIKNKTFLIKLKKLIALNKLKQFKKCILDWKSANK